MQVRNALSGEASSYSVCIGDIFFEDDMMAQCLECSALDLKSWVLIALTPGFFTNLVVVKSN